MGDGDVIKGARGEGERGRERERDRGKTRLWEDEEECLS
jgi:hypothetical protein